MEYIGGLEHFKLYPEIGQPTWVELIIVQHANDYVEIHVEIDDPSTHNSVRDLTLSNGISDLTQYLAYRRNFQDNSLEPINWTTPIVTGLSVVVISIECFNGKLAPLRYTLAHRTEVLPARMIWPVF